MATSKGSLIFWKEVAPVTTRAQLDTLQCKQRGTGRKAISIVHMMPSKNSLKWRGARGREDSKGLIPFQLHPLFSVGCEGEIAQRSTPTSALTVERQRPFLHTEPQHSAITGALPLHLEDQLSDDSSKLLLELSLVYEFSALFLKAITAKGNCQS